MNLLVASVHGHNNWVKILLYSYDYSNDILKDVVKWAVYKNHPLTVHTILRQYQMTTIKPEIVMLKHVVHHPLLNVAVEMGNDKMLDLLTKFLEKDIKELDQDKQIELFNVACEKGHL